MTLSEEIEKGESKTLEFKKELPADSYKWLKTVVAFANGAGGKIIVGVSNNRDIPGIAKEKDIFELKDGIADCIGQGCEPQIMFDVNAETVNSSQVVVIQIYPGNATPYHIKALGKENGTFVRLGATTRQADATILNELHNRGLHIFYDEFPNTELEFTEDDINALCKDFSERAERKITRKDLENLHLLIGNKKETGTNALAILLGRHGFTSRIQCAQFKGIERVHFLDKKEFEGPLCEQIDGAYNFVLSHINMALEIDGIVHKEKYELPVAAIRELIVNAVVHRNYQMSSSVQVAVFDDRVEISSPGGMYGSLTLEEALQGRSSLRNQTLARTLEKIGIIEGWGSGFKRVFDLCDEQNISHPEFLEIGDLLRVNFFRPTYKIGDKSAIKSNIGDKIGDKSEIGDKNPKDLILEYLNEHKVAKASEISEILGLKASRTRDYLSELVGEGKIFYEGENKARRYFLK